MPKISITLNSSWNIFNHRLGLLKALSDEGFEIFCIAPEDDYSAKLPYNYLKWNLDKRGSNPFGEVLSIYELHKIYKKLKPDIALHFTIKPNIYGTFCTNQLKIPSINNVSGLGYGFQTDSGVVKNIAGKLYLKYLGYSSKIFFQNQIDMDYFLSKKPNLSSISDRLPGSGVDIQKFKPMSKVEKNEVVFLMAARLFKEKGAVEYIEAAQMIKKKYPNARFFLLGDIYKVKNNPVTTEYLNKCVRHGIIEYYGMQDDMQFFFHQADCVVLPTYYREGCPRVLIEAASCAIPIITTDNVGCIDIVEDGYNGYLCEKQSVQSLKSKIEAFLQLSFQERLTLGNNGREKVIKEFDEKIIIKKYLKSIYALL